MSNSQAQDRDSLGLLLGQKMWLHRCALRMGYRTESAEDAVQETFLLASQSEPRSLGLGWLRRTLQRQLGMQRRSERRRYKREQQTAKPEAMELDPAGPLEQLEFQREIQRSVAQLPQRDREVLALRFVADLSIQEIAKSLGQTPNAVSSRLSRALNRLRSVLGPDGYPRASHDRLAWLTLPVANFLRQTAPSLGTAVTFLPNAFLACLAILMKKTLLALVLLVTLGSLIWFANLPGDVSPERQVADAANSDLDARHELGSAAQVTLPAQTVERTVLAVDNESPEPKPGINLAPRGSGSVRVRCLEVDKATPVAGMTIELKTKYRGARTFGRAVVRRTNEQGEALFDEVEPGTIRALLTRFVGTKGRNWAAAEIKAGETVEILFEVDPQQEVHGVVVNEAGQPVADAGLWIGHRPGPVDTGYLVGKSGADGRFALKYVGPNQFVCARAKGYAPSLSASPGFATDYATKGLRLVLSARRGTLRGTVRSPSGEPLQDVVVSIGERITSAPGPGYYWTPIPQWRETDAAGSFEFRDVGIGEVTVRARGSKAAPWNGRASIPDGGVAELLIQLHAGGTLVGQVRTERGTPSPGAHIAAFSSEEAFVPQVETRADEEGRFRLSGVNAGEMILEAKSQDRLTTFRETLYIYDLAEQLWSPVLSPSPNLKGFVFSESGKPLKGWQVYARPTLGGMQSSFGVSVLGDGSFSLEPKPGETYSLRVYPPGRSFGPAALVVESFDPQNEAPTLIVPTEQIPTAGVRGQLVSDAGEALAGRVTISVATTPVTNIERSTAPDGRFQFHHLPEGSFTLTLQGGGYETREVPSIGNLVRDEERDLGHLTLRKR